MTEERRQLIKRLEECKYKHKEFYKTHPDFLEELNAKIYALKNGNEYTIKDVIEDASTISMFSNKKIIILEECNFLKANKSIDDIIDELSYRLYY